MEGWRIRYLVAVVSGKHFGHRRIHRVRTTLRTTVHGRRMTAKTDMRADI